MIIIIRTLLCPLVASMFLVAPAAQAQDNSDLQRLQRAETDLDSELVQVERDILQDRERLQREQSQLPAADITTSLLEDARLEQALLRSRQTGLKTRLKARRDAMVELEADAIALEDRIRRAADEVERSLLQEQSRQLQQHRAVLESLTDKLDRLRVRYGIRAALARERLTLLQTRFELPDLGADRQFLGPAGKDLQKKVDELLATATAARRDAASLGQDTPQETAQRRLLDLQALAAEEQAEFHQLSIVRLQVERVLQSLSTLSRSLSVPVKVLNSGLDNIDRMQEELQRQHENVVQKRAQFLDQRQIINQQGAIASGTDSTLVARLALIDELSATADAQLDAITSLEERIGGVRNEFQATAAASAGAELAQRRVLPADAESWQRLMRNMATLPLRIIQAFRQALLNIGAAFAQSDVLVRVLSLLLLPILALAGWQGQRALSRRLATAGAAATEEESAASSLALLERNFLGLIPALFVIGAGLLLNLRQGDFVLLLAPLLIWPVVRIAMDLIKTFLDEYTPELDASRTQLLQRESRRVVIVATIIAAVLVTAYTVALSPAVLDAIERLAMLGLLLIALSLIRLRKLLLEGMRGEVESRLLRWSTLAIPLLLLVCGIIGIAGYVDLGWAIAARLGWLILVGLGVHVVRIILRSVLRTLVRWRERSNAETRVFWQQYVLGPAYRLTLLLVLLAAVQLLLHLYNWNSQTPGFRALPLLLDSTLFTIGDTAIKLKTLGLALLALFVAIWGGGWSKQVSYRWLYTGVQDQGIRSSLATFTQYLVVVIGLVAAMKIIGLDLTALTVFAGALGVGIGFGMQQIVVNFISGILLLVERPLATTDLVAVDKYEGEVTRIGIRSLTVKTFDNQEVIIPNSSVITKPFTNWTRSDDIMRFVLMVGISYDDDPHEAIALIRDIVKTHPAVLETPAIKVLLWDYGDSALMLRAQFFTRIRGPIGRADVRSQVLLTIWDRFKEAGISIPYPQRDVHMRGPDQGH